MNIRLALATFIAVPCGVALGAPANLFCGTTPNGGYIPCSTVNLNVTGDLPITCADAGENGSVVSDTTRVCIHDVLTNASTDTSPTALSVYADTSGQQQLVTAAHFDVNALAGGGLAWAINPVANSFPGALGGVIADEEDVNNWTCDPGNVDNLIPACPAGNIGIYITGASPYPSQSAIAISGVSTANAQWHEGITAIGLHVVDYATFYQKDGASYGYIDSGAHVGNAILLSGAYQNPAIAVSASSPGAIDIVASNNTQFAIRMPSSSASQIYWPTTNSSLNADAAAGISVSGPVRSVVYAQGSVPTSCVTGQIAYGAKIRLGSQAAGAGLGSPIFCNDSAVYVVASTGLAPTY